VEKTLKAKKRDLNKKKRKKRSLHLWSAADCGLMKLSLSLSFRLSLLAASSYFQQRTAPGIHRSERTLV